MVCLEFELASYDAEVENVIQYTIENALFINGK